MKATGLIKIEEGLELQDPTLEIVNVKYNWIEQTVDVECYFTEGGGVYKHSRTFTYPTSGSGELTAIDIINFINNDEILSVFE